MEHLAAHIQAFLFVEGGSLTKRKLESLLGVKKDALEQGLRDLSAGLEGSGLALIETDTEVSLAASAESSAMIEKVFERELGKEIGDAGLEVIAILLYRGPSTRAQIDYIRGVNTSSTIRTLLSRGLVERVGNPDDGREYLYRPTSELLAHLGVKSAADVPEHAAIAQELATFESQAQAAAEEHHEPGE